MLMINDSYALIRFKDFQSKQAFCNSTNEIFGIVVGDTHCWVKDGDIKHQLSVRNFNYGTNLSEICEFLNRKLEEKGLKPFELESQHVNMVLTGDIFFINFNGVEEALRALSVLNKQVFQNSQLKLSHVTSKIEKDGEEDMYQNKFLRSQQKLEELRKIEKIKKQQNIVLNQGFSLSDEDDIS